MQHKNQKLTSFADNILKGGNTPWHKFNISAQVAVKAQLARVRLVPGEGKIIINKRDVEDYLPYETLHSNY